MSTLDTTCSDLQKVLHRINTICTHLHHINTSIFKVETESEELLEQVVERRRTVEEVSDVIERLMVPGELVSVVNGKRVCDEFENALPTLDQKSIGTINAYYDKAIAQMLDNQDTDLHIFRATHLEKRMALLSFLRKHSPPSASAIVKQYTTTSIVLHERKLNKFLGSLKNLLLEEPLALIGDSSVHRRRRSLLKRFDSLDLFVGKTAASANRRPSDSESKLPLSYLLPRLLEYMQTVISEEEVFLEKMIPDMSDRALALGALLVPLFKIAERGCTDLVEPVFCLPTLEQCKVQLKATEQKRLETLRATCLNAVSVKYDQVIGTQCESIKRFKSVDELNTVSHRLKDLLDSLNSVPLQLQSAFDESIDDFIKSKTPQAIASALENTLMLFGDTENQDRLSHLAHIYAATELTQLEPSLPNPLTTADCTVDSVNHLVSCFNERHNQWLPEFHLHTLHHFTRFDSVICTIVNGAFKSVLLEAHQNISTARSVMDPEQMDSLVPIATVISQIKQQLDN